MIYVLPRYGPPLKTTSNFSVSHVLRRELVPMMMSIKSYHSLSFILIYVF